MNRYQLVEGTEEGITVKAQLDKKNNDNNKTE